MNEFRKGFGTTTIWAAFTALGLLASPPMANADEIGIGGASGSITFTSNGDGTVSFNLPAPGFVAAAPLATFQSPTGTVLSWGTATFGSMSGMAGPESSGVFPITSLTPATGETFSYTATSAGATDALMGTVIWPDIKDNTTSPSFDVNAVLDIATSAGSPIFTGDFPVGGTAEIDFTVNVGITLTNLAQQGKGSAESGTFSAGEVVPYVPEPASLTILATALVGLGWLGRRRGRQV